MLDSVKAQLRSMVAILERNNVPGPYFINPELHEVKPGVFIGYRPNTGIPVNEALAGKHDQRLLGLSAFTVVAVPPKQEVSTEP